MPKNTGEKGGLLSESDFITPAQDAKGHSERVWCRIQPGHDRQADTILRSKRFPFRTKGDLVRWSLVRGMAVLLAIDETIPSVLVQVDSMLDILRDEAFQQDYLIVFDTMGRVIAKHIEMRALGEARRLVAIMQHKIRLMPEGYWRDKYEADLMQRFGYLLE